MALIIKFDRRNNKNGGDAYNGNSWPTDPPPNCVVLYALGRPQPFPTWTNYPFRRGGAIFVTGFRRTANGAIYQRHFAGTSKTLIRRSATFGTEPRNVPTANTDRDEQLAFEVGVKARGYSFDRRTGGIFFPVRFSAGCPVIYTYRLCKTDSGTATVRVAVGLVDVRP